jgi:hypothetical protein
MIGIVIANQITLKLESTPPQAPGEAILNAPEYFNDNSFKANQV